MAAGMTLWAQPRKAGFPDPPAGWGNPPTRRPDDQQGRRGDPAPPPLGEG